MVRFRPFDMSVMAKHWATSYLDAYAYLQKSFKSQLTGKALWTFAIQKKLLTEEQQLFVMTSLENTALNTCDFKEKKPLPDLDICTNIEMVLKFYSFSKCWSPSNGDKEYFDATQVSADGLVQVCCDFAFLVYCFFCHASINNY